MKFFPNIVFILYLLALLWLVLFKFSFDIPSVIMDFQSRSLNIVPFLGNDLEEMVDNIIIFVPFGLFLRGCFKQTTLRQSLIAIGVFSLTIEITQYMLAIGAADITDVIMNTFGGFVGLSLYDSLRGHANKEKLDQYISIVTLFILIVLILLRTFVFKVRY